MPRRKKSENTDSEPTVVSETAVASDSPPAAPVQKTLRERREAIEAVTTERRRSEESGDFINAFFQASKSGNVLESKIVGVISEGQDAYWQCVHGPITIRIPFEETFDTLPPSLLDPNTFDLGARLRQFLNKSIGLTIRYIVTEFKRDPDNQGRAIVIGSRIRAMEKDRRYYFGDGAYRPMQKGDIVTAQVLNVGNHIAWVHFCGMDVRVRAVDFSHRYLPDLTEVYTPGQKVRMQITRLEQDPQSGAFSVSLSARPVELEESKARRCLAAVGSTYAATVTAKTTRMDADQPFTIVNLWLEGVDIPAYSKAQIPSLDAKDFIKSGDTVYAQILGYTDSGYAHCKIKRRAGRSY